MGSLVVKAGEKESTFENLWVFVDEVNVRENRVVVKMADMFKPGYEHKLVLSPYEFEDLIKQYNTLKSKVRRTCPVWKLCQRYETIVCEGFNEDKCKVYKMFLEFKKQGLSDEEAIMKAIEEYMDEVGDRWI